MPLIIDESEWMLISHGLIAARRAARALVADIYGDNHLVARGVLPPELIARNPEFLRPMVGIKPASGHYLHFCAFELGRGPDGGWWVLGDRTQAPSGAGFALENRVATTRALSDIYAQHATSIASPASSAISATRSIGEARRNDGRVAILTPGQHNETYFEHAYIARYLGFMLLEGEDLVVEDGQVMVRTVAGLKPVSVLWRRMDASFTDPLELRYDSRIGTPGHGRGAAPGLDLDGQRHRLGHPRNPRPRRLHAAPQPGAARRRRSSCRPSPPGGAARTRSASTSSTISIA